MIMVKLVPEQTNMKSSAAEYFRSMSPVKCETKSVSSNLFPKSVSSKNEKAGRCHCCPYGYHIDLDFVRYCQVLNQGSKNDNPTLVQLKKLKKERRRQTKSIEAMLGIPDDEEERAWFKQPNFTSFSTTLENSSTSLYKKPVYPTSSVGQSIPTPPPREKKSNKFSFTPPSPPPRRQSLTHPALKSPPPPDIINSSSYFPSRRSEQASNALHEAVLDFEEALESSKDHPKKKYVGDDRYRTLDLLHHTPSYASRFGQKTSVGRSNSLPRQFLYDGDSHYATRQQIFEHKDWNGTNTLNNGYTNGAFQTPLMSDAMSALNAARGYSSTLPQDSDAISVTSMMSAASTNTLQSIRDQMATGLSRLKELEEEVRNIPKLQISLNILREEKRILMEQVRCYQRGEEPPLAPPSLDRDLADLADEDLERNLQSLKSHSRRRNRSISPMRVNLEDFQSYRRARRGSVSEGSDTESVHSYRGHERSSREENNRLFISESGDSDWKVGRKNATSLPSTPIMHRRSTRDVAVTCKVLTRDVGISYVPPRMRSIGTGTSFRIEDKEKPCQHCLERKNTKKVLTKNVGTSPIVRKDSGSNKLSRNSISSENIDDIDAKAYEHGSAKNVLLEKLGKKSPIVSRLSSSQLCPPVLTFDNSTNTDPPRLRDQRLNTYLRMEDLFTEKELKEHIKEAKLSWETSNRKKFEDLFTKEELNNSIKEEKVMWETNQRKKNETLFTKEQLNQSIKEAKSSWEDIKKRKNENLFTREELNLSLKEAKSSWEDNQKRENENLFTREELNLSLKEAKTSWEDNQKRKNENLFTREELNLSLKEAKLAWDANQKRSNEHLFTKDELNQSLREAKMSWEANNRKKSVSPLKEIPKKIYTSEKGVQVISTPPKTHNVGIMAKQTTKDTGVGYASIIEPMEKKSTAIKTKSIGVGTSPMTPVPSLKRSPSIRTRSIGIGDGKLTDIICSECVMKQNVHMKSVGVSHHRTTDIICDKCDVKKYSVGVGDCRITDELCKKCKLKRTSNFGCQIRPATRSVSIGVDMSPTPHSLYPASLTKDNLAITPEAERRPFGSSGVQICDKCHETITSVAKDMVNTNGSPSSSSAANLAANQSKIPRRVGDSSQKQPEVQLPEVVTENVSSTTTTVAAVPERVVSSGTSTVESNKKRDTSSLSLNFKQTTRDEVKPNLFASSIKSSLVKNEDKSQLKDDASSICSSMKSPIKDDALSLYSSMKSPIKDDASSICSSVVSSIGASPQLKSKIPFHRQDTYTKSPVSEGVDNPAFNEIDPKESPKLIPRKKSPNKERKLIKKRSTDSVIKEETPGQSSGAEDDATSIAASSVVTAETITIEGTENKAKKATPSREMKAALKVLNDSIGKSFRSGQQLNNAINIIQKEWFKVSSQKDANPHSVEDYMDAFEKFSKALLSRVVNLCDNNGNTAMHYSVSHGNFDVVSVLLDSKVCNINQQNKAGYTSIMLVALAPIKNGAHASVVKKLFESGDINIKASQHGQTALMLAVSHGRLDMVKMLIPSGADANIQDEDGSTALMCAAEHGHLAIVKFLIASPDTDLYIMDNDGSTALTIAVEAGHKDVGVMLYKQMNLSRGSSPYGSMRGGKRPRTPTMARASRTPPPRSSAPSSPGRSRKSSGRTSPATGRQSSASLSNLNF